ncbi:hypothetical protein D3C72_1611230 [compost metagenome]
MKNSWKGEPSGSFGGTGPLPSVLTFCEVEIFTTASRSGSARSATDSGPWLCANAATGAVRLPATSAMPAIAAMLLRKGERRVTAISVLAFQIVLPCIYRQSIRRNDEV